VHAARRAPTPAADACSQVIPMTFGTNFVTGIFDFIAAQNRVR
jgi:hypothetical protein